MTTVIIIASIFLLALNVINIIELTKSCCRDKEELELLKKEIELIELLIKKIENMKWKIFTDIN